MLKRSYKYIRISKCFGIGTSEHAVVCMWDFKKFHLTQVCFRVKKEMPNIFCEGRLAFI